MSEELNEEINCDELTLKNLLEVGAHFGHQTHKWNPKMKKYVFGEKNGIYIIDLSKTIEAAQTAANFLKKVKSSGRPILFVGTKRQASEAVRKAAEDCGAFFVTYRWLGGMLTNFKTITLSIDKLRKVEKMKETGDFSLLTKKERINVDKNVEKLERNLGGIKDMRKLPGAIFVIDATNERIAIKEANTLGIPVVAIVDTNCDPDGIQYVVPGNDDAIKSIKMFAGYFSNAISTAPRKSSGEEPSGRDTSMEKEMEAKHKARQKSKKDDAKGKE